MKNLYEESKAGIRKQMKFYFTVFTISFFISIVATIYGIFYLGALYGNILTALVCMLLFLPGIPFIIALCIGIFLWGMTYTSLKMGLEQYNIYKYHP